MNVYYISSSLIPSQEANSVHVMKMCQAFADHGHNVTLFGRRGLGAAQDKEIFSIYGVKSNFEIILEAVPPLKVIWNFVYTHRLLKSLKTLTAPDILYSRYPYGLLRSQEKFPHAEMVLESHALPRSTLQRKIETRLLKNKRLKRLVVISQTLKDDYLALFPFLSPSKIVVAHDGADTLTVPPANTLPKLRGEEHKAKAKAKAMYCGRLTEGKGLGLLSALIPLCPEVEFHIIGGSDAEVSFWREKINAPNAHFYGHINHGDLAGYYVQMDVMLAPLQTENKLSGSYDIGRWTSPLKVFEYMAAAKPIIASDIEVLREVLTHQKNCLLAAPNNAQAWKVALVQLLADKNLSKSLGQNAFDDLSSKYTWTMRAENVIAE